MTLKLAKMIFWFGTMSSLLIFLILTFDTMGQMGERTNEQNLTEEVVAGKRVFEKYSCNVCHTILGIGGYYAPDLTRVYGRKGPVYIKKIILNPEKTLENSIRKMPKKYAGGYKVQADEVDKLISFFKWVDGIDTNNWPPQDHKEKTFGGNAVSLGQIDAGGGSLLRTNGCIECHIYKGLGDDIGPALDGVGARLEYADIRKLIQEGGEEMPAQEDLSPEDLDSISKFLAGQKGGQ